MTERDAIRDGNPSSPLSRRTWLEVTAAAGLGLAAPAFVRAAAGPELRARARKNLKLGIMSNVYGELSVDEAARQIKADGFACVVTDFAFADVHFNPLEPDWAAAKKIVSTLEREGVEIVGLFGYYNIVDPDVKRRKLGEARMEAILTNVKRLGCRLVSTETGTFNSQSEWESAPENQTEEGYLQCRAVFQKHARTAEKYGAVLSIEAYYRNIIGTIDRAELLFREVNSPALRLVMDPCNFFRKEDLPRMKPMLEAMFQRLGDQIVIAHAKDVKPSPTGEDLPAAGLGVLDYPVFLRLLARLDRPLPLVVEHLRRPDVARARDFVLGQLERI
jgi:sugar phosphate isomerase/epimerase